MINLHTDFYLCTICFNVSESPQVCHDREMVHCTDCHGEQRKLLMDGNGRLLNRAPAWFINISQPAPLTTITVN